MRHLRFHTDVDIHSRSFLLKRVQPALSGLMDGSLSTLAPIFAVVLATHRPLTAFYTGLATALGAGVSMAFSEGLWDSGDLIGRGKPVRPRGDHGRRCDHLRAQRRAGRGGWMSGGRSAEPAREGGQRGERAVIEVAQDRCVG